MHWLFLISNLLYAIFNWFVEIDHFNHAQQQADSYYQEKLYLEALKVYEPIQPNVQNNINYKLNVAHLYSKTFQYSDALKIYQNLLQANNDQVKQICWHQMGVIFYQTKKYELAKSNFKMALKLNPNDSVASYNYELVSKMIHSNHTSKNKQQAENSIFNSKGKSEKDILNKKEYQKTSIDKERTEILLNYIDEMEPQRIVEYNKNNSKSNNLTTY
jgi:tetratricopeptide (TPR) repeat protein